MTSDEHDSVALGMSEVEYAAWGETMQAGPAMACSLNVLLTSSDLGRTIALGEFRSCTVVSSACNVPIRLGSAPAEQSSDL